MELKAYKTIEELESDVYSLGHWADPNELQKYLEVLYRITAFDSKYEIDLTIPEGLTGTFVGAYNPDVRKVAREVCSSKFPARDEVWDKDGKLKPGLPKEVAYLGNYVVDPAGLNYIVERTPFVSICTSLFGYLNMKTTVEEVKQLEASAAQYLANKNKVR